MESILKPIQYTGFIFTQLSNILLLILIFTRACNRFGAYKYLMISYAIYSLIYSWIEIAAQPVVHTFGSGVFIFCDSFLKYEKSISAVLIALYCASFALCISLLATHFVYRLIAVSKPQILHYFDGFRLSKLFFIPFILSVFWYWACGDLCGMSDVKSEYMRAQILKIYDVDTYRVGYISVVYFLPLSPTNIDMENVQFSWIDFFGALVCFLVMGFCVTVIIFCGWKTYYSMNKVVKMSKRTKELNDQLFKSLILQTLIPLLTMFFPVGFVIFMPIFYISIGKMTNIAVISASFYPGFDALIAIFMIRDFRDTVLCRQKVGKVYTSSTTILHRHSVVQSV